MEACMLPLEGGDCSGTWLTWEPGGPGFVILTFNLPADVPQLGLIAYSPALPGAYLWHLPEWNRKEFHYDPGGTFTITVTFGQEPGQCAKVYRVEVPPLLPLAMVPGEVNERH